MLVHSVFFWLKPELTDQQRTDFRRAVEGLGAIESVRHSWVGTPSATERRPAVDHTFSLAFTTVYDDVAGQTVYQVHPLHLEFLKHYKPYWTRIQIYDAD
jgi:hypothetical protein